MDDETVRGRLIFGGNWKGLKYEWPGVGTLEHTYLMPSKKDILSKLVDPEKMSSALCAICAKIPEIIMYMAPEDDEVEDDLTEEIMKDSLEEIAKKVAKDPTEEVMEDVLEGRKIETEAMDPPGADCCVAASELIANSGATDFPGANCYIEDENARFHQIYAPTPLDDIFERDQGEEKMVTIYEEECAGEVVPYL